MRLNIMLCLRVEHFLVTEKGKRKGKGKRKEKGKRKGAQVPV